MKNTDGFRAGELARLTGLPRTTLHYYLRVGLLPPGRKLSGNSALYFESHVERIRLIQRLRSAEFGSLSIARIHRVLDRVDKGVSVELAVELERAMGLPSNGDEPHASLDDLSARFEVPVAALETMVRLGLLVPDPFGRLPGFNGLEGKVALLLHEIVRDTCLELEDLAPIAGAIAELSRYEMELRDRVVEAVPSGQENAEATLRLQQLANLLHPYLLSRSMEKQIAGRRLRDQLSAEKPS